MTFQKNHQQSEWACLLFLCYLFQSNVLNYVNFRTIQIVLDPNVFQISLGCWCSTLHTI